MGGPVHRKMTTRTVQRRVIPALWVAGILTVWVFGFAELVKGGSPPGLNSSWMMSRSTDASRSAYSSRPSSPTNPQEPGDAVTDELTRGQTLFARQCALCHGENGDGGGRFAYLMNPRPRNFLKGKFKLVTTQNRIPSDEDLLRVITRGMPGSAMPPWGHLPTADLKALVAYVRHLRREAVRQELARGVAEGAFSAAETEPIMAERTRPGAPLVIPAEAPFDDLRWFNGRRIYLEACASCHGVDGHPVAEAVKFDEDGYPDPPRSFVNGIFKGGMDGASLFARITLGMPGTPMPAYETTYAADDMWDLIHYVQSLARSGSQDRAQLRQGTVTAARAATLPAAPDDPSWNQAKALYVAMTPLWWVEDRIEGVVIQALHDDSELAVRLSWLDPTRDERSVRVDEFRDAVAIQFALTTDPPFYMGDTREGGGVNIWLWKAEREKNIASGFQDVGTAFSNHVVDRYSESNTDDREWMRPEGANDPITEHNPLFITAWGAGNLVANPTLTTPVESLTAHGPGTLAAKPANIQVVAGQAQYERGIWTVQLQRALELPRGHAPAADGGEERVFRSGDYLPISLAIWNGSAGDRDGKKNISIWQKMVIE